MSVLRACLGLLPATCLHVVAVNARGDRASLGNDALANGLWEVASEHFRASLDDPLLSPSLKPEIAIRYAESLLRSGLAQQALELTDQSFANTHPESTFWKAQALTGLGRFHEALGLFQQRLDTRNHARFLETVLTVANLHLALGSPDQALEVLKTPAPETSNATASAKPVLRRVEILLDAGRPQDARVLLPDVSSLPADLVPLGRLLEGRLLLSEGLPLEAGARFSTVIEAGLPEDSRLLHLAALGQADAFLAQELKSEALDFITSFLKNHPSSSQIPHFFERLLPLLPSSPSATDPWRVLLDDWCGPAPVPATGLIACWDTDGSGSMPVADAPETSRPLALHALYTQAVTWLRSPHPQARFHSRYYANRLFMQAPGHPLCAQLMVECARFFLTVGQTPQALDALDSLMLTTRFPSVRGRSAFLQAEASWHAGKSSEASDLFHLAAASLESDMAETARFNAHVARLVSQPDEPALSAIPEGRPSGIDADLSLEHALATRDAATRRQRLEAFLMRYPEHPRMAEARLAAADASLHTHPPDLAYAAAQLDTILTLPDHARPPAIMIDSLGIRISDLKGDGDAAIRLSAAFVERHPAAPETPEIMFVLGKNLYHAGKYNDARLSLERLASVDKDLGRAQACWLLSARAAAMVATQASKQESLILFDKAISLPGTLADIARMEKARLLIDMGRAAEAQQLLEAWFGALPPAHPTHLPGGFLLAEAVRSQSTPEALDKSMAIYDRLLAHTKKDPAAFHRLQYLRGLTYEQMGSPDSTSGRRIREAFAAFYSVLETEAPPAEWHFFELCGFKALGMLIDAGRWPAAITCARRIASFHGPRAEEAAEIATQLQLKHMVWED